ncbi:MAG: hypothetical protein A2268_11430 [Candidatus Raymondbacteria bacterium RifOxyA12_full_50_37]|uniref:Alginate lyase domain-containing protein n=1 Tax=Candidatus Raymondbacteria bacterium RIFOXYD12_FULL_49_13 TaxID=1817890 RepID=A0A1F7FAE5_UNCRA|nr:MAG: hypothetical protein A2268_11430 [Candidatus Raymondbacteria bacterium RifOxyA12_full_50_37]OGJ92380.1 MAG: hypothetical protein A2248_10555 [Candidatus Raymondbacteria bacterium RIFOXYA2_FULL_49_16]OGJ96593.1 MAG: hypothetical protein A2350_03155 [Candidatus Raymondbacteria bacterium RifOxyB12_full_50_8]OGJ99361.1 MAG: hypothetical protein A2453_13615 [Candidatus Raymondbacteria bacterium RIFOXYC2_FULL_50_21]OGK03625.1 MAG: hypothetical protein A2519_02505 [Candidatus Raymondbacteria b
MTDPLTRRDFVLTAALAATAAAIGADAVFAGDVEKKGGLMSHAPSLDTALILSTKRRIELAMLPVMESAYGSGKITFGPAFRPELKTIEKVVSFYDYKATGISVLAAMAASGHARAVELIRNVLNTMEHYRTAIYNHDVEGYGRWTVPLRRLIFHAALAYQSLEGVLNAGEKEKFRLLLEQQVEAAIEHNKRFLPGVKDLYLTRVNNHTAIFMQGVYYAGKIFDRPEWSALTLEFAERFYASGHPDGYWEEHTNEQREGGPSLLYTPLTAGCLYDVLDGQHHPREKFIKAGNFYRSFLNYDNEHMPFADERSNAIKKWPCYGLALHSLTPQGRGYIAEVLRARDYTGNDPEELAVIYHELDLMQTGPCETQENRKDGENRLTLPLGVVRRNGWTAGISAVCALNRMVAADSDYALDQQTMVYLSHKDTGVVLTGFKSKKDPAFSTFRVGDDAYTVKTGTLEMGSGWAQAVLFYQTFTAGIRWDVRSVPKLTLTADTDREVVTTLPVTDLSRIRSKAPFAVVDLKGFSPYTQENAAPGVKAVRFSWKKQLEIEFALR